MSDESNIEEVINIMNHALAQTCEIRHDEMLDKDILFVNYASDDRYCSSEDDTEIIDQDKFICTLLEAIDDEHDSIPDHEKRLLNASVSVEQMLQNSVSLSSLINGVISISPEELIFLLHPRKASWLEKVMDKYSLYIGADDDVFRSQLTFLFSNVKCSVDNCAFNDFYPHLQLFSGPQILPKFVLESINNHLNNYYEILTFCNCVERLRTEIEKGEFPKICICCLLMQQLENGISRRWTINHSNIQSYVFNVFGIDELYHTKCGSLGMIKRNDIRADVLTENVFDPKADMFSLQILPFTKIKISEDNMSIDKYKISWV